LLQRTHIKPRRKDAFLHNAEIVDDNQSAGVAKKHYDVAYYEWQQKIGRFGAAANIFKFEPYIQRSWRVIDFGCGGGFLLSTLQCSERVGIEVNPAAISEATRNGIRTVSDASNIPDGWADAIISNSALEHVEDPLGELRKLYPKLRAGGRIIFSLPHERMEWKYHPGDVNQHLFTWSPMSAGNLFRIAGYQVDSVYSVFGLWPPGAETILRIVGRNTFRRVCTLYAGLLVMASFLRKVKVDGAVVVVATKA
jgi:2-polyprenyl-3-methyl-5-hydroxy-6-metoxy-1,4-benzoquinol methylase